MPVSPFLQREKSSAASFHLLTHRIAHTGHNPPLVQHWLIQEIKARNKDQI